MTEKLLTPYDVAKAFNVAPITVTRWANKGLISCVRTPGGHRRYRETEVAELLRSTGEGEP